MLQQQIKAQNTVQNSHAQQKNIVPSIVNTSRTSNSYCQAIFSPTLLQPNDKGAIHYPWKQTQQTTETSGNA